MKKDLKKEIKEIFNLCLLCGVAIAVVFHLNSALSASNNKVPQTKKHEFSAASDSVQAIKSKQMQKTR